MLLTQKTADFVAVMGEILRFNYSNIVMNNCLLNLSLLHWRHTGLIRYRLPHVLGMWLTRCLAVSFSAASLSHTGMSMSKYHRANHSRVYNWTPDWKE